MNNKTKSKERARHTSLWSVIVNLQDRLEGQGFDNARVDAVVQERLEMLLAGVKA